MVDPFPNSQFGALLRWDAVQFGLFDFDPATGTLLRDGTTVALGHRARQLLSVLARNSGEVVSKETLLDAAWPGQAVEESNLSVQIAALRPALGTEPTLLKVRMWPEAGIHAARCMAA
jgi:DNA-binding winged helix-turn-helix (wHTH) protein